MYFPALAWSHCSWITLSRIQRIRRWDHRAIETPNNFIRVVYLWKGMETSLAIFLHHRLGSRKQNIVHNSKAQDRGWTGLWITEQSLYSHAKPQRICGFAISSTAKRRKISKILVMEKLPCLSPWALLLEFIIHIPSPTTETWHWHVTSIFVCKRKAVSEKWPLAYTSIEMQRVRNMEMLMADMFSVSSDFIR